MGIMATGVGVYIVATMSQENICKKDIVVWKSL